MVLSKVVPSQNCEADRGIFALARVRARSTDPGKTDGDRPHCVAVLPTTLWPGLSGHRADPLHDLQSGFHVRVGC